MVIAVLLSVVSNQSSVLGSVACKAVAGGARGLCSFMVSCEIYEVIMQILTSDEWVRYACNS
ncbi:MAG: hypothetical protein QS748_05170 [Candidatus Endonucleobacter bathymodioli]|uniref:Uncharacterized protein n=1 Tax=Candidatus Endonucleibacter bathymodioli TaxID=539814 RepID=A0AA90SM85_9GAMM|nr:hypothetical protein [Candidatus Endonucleobacter bathymodioli]